MIHIRNILPLLGVAAVMASACSDDVVEPGKDADNAIPGQEVGIKALKVSIPRLKRLDGVVNHASVRLHLRGRNDRVNYPINTFITLDEDSVYLEADDPILAELPHQMYHLNAVTFPRRAIASRAEAQEDTIYLGARLSIENPDNIGFRSSFNVAANSIGSGSEEDPWIIASGDDFMKRISDSMVRGKTHEGEYFEITRNINLNTTSVAYGKGWEPAGHNNADGGFTDFNGTIDGCDNYIENLYCFTDAGCGGLFYSLGEKAYIHNLEMRRVMLNGQSLVGAFASTSKKGCRLERVEVNGAIQGFEKTGGFIGSGDADFSQCISSVNVSGDGSGSYIGGMIGQTNSSTFTDCIRTGRLDATNVQRAGGYVGGSDAKEMTIFTRCYVGGIIQADRYTGGFMGRGYAEFTDCHAAATLPQDSYTYSTRWDIFNLNNRMTPMPMEITGGLYTGGFAGFSDKLVLHGTNSFAYESPAKPNITSTSHIGALAGKCNYYGDDSASFTSRAFLECLESNSSGNTGGVFGNVSMYAGGTFVNYGNIMATSNFIGGIFGDMEVMADFTMNCKNTGNVKGTELVGGIAGRALGFVKGRLENDGNVEASGNTAGGLFGEAEAFDLADGSHVGSVNGSLKITGNGYLGGIAGIMRNGKSGKMLAEHYCPVYANIIGNEYLGGLFGQAAIYRGEEQMFRYHYPVVVSITANGGDRVGGVIGYMSVTKAVNFAISGFKDNLQVSITTSGNSAGGIVGCLKQTYDRGNYKFEITDCDNFTSINSTASGEVSGFGGIIGNRCEIPSAATVKISRCSNHASIGGANVTSIGGIIGYCYGATTVERCYNAGKVDGIKAVGGIAGRLAKDGAINYCFNMGEVPSVSGRTYLAGIIGHKEKNSSAVTVKQCYNVGSTGWGIIGGESGSSFSLVDCYYLATASNGDMKNSGSHSATADAMRRTATYANWSNSGAWSFSDGKRAPILQGMSLYGKTAPLQK